MSVLRLLPRRRNAKLTAHRKGVVLVLVIFFIVLASLLAALVMSNSAQLARTTRHNHESILLRQLTDSAQAWVHAHGCPPGDTPVTLAGDFILPEGTSGHVTIDVDGALPNAIVILAQVSFDGRLASRTTRFPLPN